MSCPVNFNLDNISTPGKQFAIYQGSTYDCLTLYHDQDISDYTPSGEIRTTYRSSGGVLVATFTFDALGYEEVTINDVAVNRTIIKPSLTDEQTYAMTPTRTRTASDRAIPGLNTYVYDISVESTSGEVITLVYGFVDVLPGVTEVS
ncbi:hypothetical protein [Myxosarcina sp. GI1(2024)]